MSAASSVPFIDLRTQKYDRQLRLWAATGQSALEHAKICLLNATATGCEILKNLVLPGVGSVTIVDNATAQEADIHNNFFLEASNIGQSRARSTAALLQELNDDATVDFIEESPGQLIHEQPEFFETFSMIIATNLCEKDIVVLADICQSIGRTLIAVQCKGLCGVFRVQAPEHTVIETHPENVIDLRLGCPFKELEEYADSVDLDALDQTDHGHIPFVVIILKYLSLWKAQHDGQSPTSYSERNRFKELIRAGMRTVDEENFEEALSNVWRLSSTETVSSAIRTIFNDYECQNITATSSAFWIICRAVKDFVENEGQGQLPLPGKLPDMKSDTPNYMKLQSIYRKKALADFAAVKERVNGLLQSLGLPTTTVPEMAIEDFCKNAAYIKVLRYRSLKDEYSIGPSSEKLTNLDEDENMGFYIIFRSAEKFFAHNGRYPGAEGGSNNEDVKLLKKYVAEMLAELHVPGPETLLHNGLMDKAIKNYVRFADKEVANMAALMGGLIAQESIKLITRQYIPINNTCVFNGLASTSSVYDL
ncbi:ThiF family protein [Dichotomocladium elegans]|nr:ThiF family protein [Dichotomocladium elegans]